MFSINILCVISNFIFKGDTIYRVIPSGGIGDRLIHPPDSLMGGYNITGTPAATQSTQSCCTPKAVQSAIKVTGKSKSPESVNLKVLSVCWLLMTVVV